MAIPIIPRVSWIAKAIGTKTVADILDVSARAVNYWMTGERTPLAIHQRLLERLYEQTQYRAMRDLGLAPLSATKYRGLYPQTYDLWTSRLSDTLDKYTGGQVGARMVREGKTIADYTRREYEDMWGDEYTRLQDAVDESGDDIEELIASP